MNTNRTLRVVCWNIERGYKPQEIASYLRECNADVYLLYELDRGVKRTGGVDMYECIRQALQLEGQYIREFFEIESAWRKIIPWGGPGGGEIGNAIFSRHPIKNYRAESLPTREPLSYTKKTWLPELFQPRDGCRKAQIFEISVGKKPLTIISSHLEFWRTSWAHHRQQLESAIGSTASTRRIVAGDFNNTAGTLKAALTRAVSREVRQVRRWLTDNHLADPFKDSDVTAGRFGINAKIDWIANSDDLSVKKAQVLNTGLSDHACLVVDYRLQD